MMDPNMSGADGNKDLETLVESFVGRSVNEKNTPVWQCLQCGKTSGKLCNIRNHIEARHIESLKLACQTCEKICKTRDSLRHHMRIHKVHGDSQEVVSNSVLSQTSRLWS